MWKYKCVTRQEFELIKDKIEKIIVMLGGNKVSVDLPYEQTTLFCFQNDILKSNFTRSIFEYNGLYYRVDEICFPNKPYIVIECGTYDELLKNCMEDADPFPYDLTDNELLAEVKYSLKIAPYPKDY